jgi:hypothetical protein
LPSVNEFLASFATGYHRVAGCGLCCNVIAPWVLNFNIEVHETPCAPPEIIFGEVVPYTIAEQSHLFAFFYLIDLRVQAEKDLNGVILIVRFDGKCNCPCESVTRVLRYVVLK